MVRVGHLVGGVVRSSGWLVVVGLICAWVLAPAFAWAQAPSAIPPVPSVTLPSAPEAPLDLDRLEQDGELPPVAPRPPPPPPPPPEPEPEPPPEPELPPDLGPPPAPAPPPSASAEPPPLTPAQVTIKGTPVFQVRVQRAGKDPAQRAQLATKVLDAGFKDHTARDIRTEKRPEGVIVFFAAEPVILLTEADARAAAEESLEVYVAGVAERVRQVLEQEQRRSQIATTVFSFSLVVFFGLIAIYLLRKTGEFLTKARGWLEENQERVPAIRLQDIEIVKPALFRSTLELALSLIRRLAQIGIIYTWLVVALSLFERTRGYTEKLTGFVLTPLSALMTRVATSLPLLLVAITAAIAVALLVRFVGLFFESVERGESELEWLQPDLARPTSILIRAGIVVATLTFAAPVVTGDPDGALSKAGAVAVAALSLSAVPVLSSAAAGVITVFGRRLRVGDFVEFGSAAGRVVKITLLDVELEDDIAVRSRVPHLLTLVKPLRLLGSRPRVVMEITLAPGASRDEVLKLLDSAATRVGIQPKVELLDVSGGGARYRVSVSARSPGDAHRLRCEVADALEKASLPLGGSA